MLDTLPFRDIWAVDFEFVANDGERPEPVCLVAWELRSGRKLRLWRDEFGDTPPYAIDPDCPLRRLLRQRRNRLPFGAGLAEAGSHP